MKIISKVWLAISFVLLLIVALKLLDAYVSFKYEVEEFQMPGPLNEAINDKKNLLNKIIFMLWSAGIYLGLNIIIMFRWAFSN